MFRASLGLFEPYDDARTCEHQICKSLFKLPLSLIHECNAQATTDDKKYKCIQASVYPFNMLLVYQYKRDQNYSILQVAYIIHTLSNCVAA